MQEQYYLSSQKIEEIIDKHEFFSLTKNNPGISVVFDDKIIDLILADIEHGEKLTQKDPFTERIYVDSLESSLDKYFSQYLIGPRLLYTLFKNKNLKIERNFFLFLYCSHIASEIKDVFNNGRTTSLSIKNPDNTPFKLAKIFNAKELGMLLEMGMNPLQCARMLQNLMVNPEYAKINLKSFKDDFIKVLQIAIKEFSSVHDNYRIYVPIINLINETLKLTQISKVAVDIDYAQVFKRDLISTQLFKALSKNNINPSTYNSQSYNCYGDYNKIFRNTFFSMADGVCLNIEDEINKFNAGYLNQFEAPKEESLTNIWLDYTYSELKPSNQQYWQRAEAAATFSLCLERQLFETAGEIFKKQNNAKYDLALALADEIVNGHSISSNPFRTLVQQYLTTNHGELDIVAIKNLSFSFEEGVIFQSTFYPKEIRHSNGKKESVADFLLTTKNFQRMQGINPEVNAFMHEYLQKTNCPNFWIIDKMLIEQNQGVIALFSEQEHLKEIIEERVVYIGKMIKDFNSKPGIERVEIPFIEKLGLNKYMDSLSINNELVIKDNTVKKSSNKI